MKKAISLLFLFLSVLACGWADDFSGGEVFVTTGKHSINYSYNSTTAVTKLTATGGDPYILTRALTGTMDEENCILTFEYKSTTGVPTDMQIFFGAPITADRSTFIGTLNAASEWTTASFNIKSCRTKFNWGLAGDYLRFDPGSESGITLYIRNFHVRTMNADEKTAQEKIDAQNSTTTVCLMKSNSITYSFPESSVDSIDILNGRFISLYDYNKNMLCRVSRSNIDSIVFHNYESFFKFNLNTLNDMTGTYDASTQEYSFNTTGGDPYVYTYALAKNLPEDSCVLSFEYKTTSGISDDLQLFLGNPITEGRSAILGSLSATSVWQTFRFNLKKYRQNFSWGSAGNLFRMDIGANTGKDLKIRSFNIYSMNAQERAEQAVTDSLTAVKAAMTTHLDAYLTANYADTLTNVSVTADKVTVTGLCSGSGNFALVEIPPYVDVTEQKEFAYRTELTGTTINVTLDRIVSRDGFSYDRALSKWAIAKELDGKDTLASHARYADDVAAIYSAKAGQLLGKKGIAAGGGSYYFQDFDLLNVHSITMNVLLNGIIQTTGGSGTTEYKYGGKTYYINNAYVAGCDEICLEAQKRGIIVNAIILTPSSSYFRDPECTGGYYTMPNMTTSQDVNNYAAALTYFAEHYSTGTYGRVHNWIMHNEVDMGSTWTNMGDQPVERYLDRYIKSMRLAYNILRQYDQNASILASYTHNWTAGENNYTAKSMLETTVKYSKLEGDFLWGVAYHPYPIDLTQPEFWKNDVKEATFTKNSLYCTFYNPEVINDWILNTDNYYKGTQKRILFFTEQGTNSPTYSETDLAKQAAGAAWMWKKIQALKGIDAMQWHNWKDNSQEFGLRIGLRAFAEASTGFNEYDCKPVWYVWQAAGTDTEDTVFKPYLTTIGTISSWDNLVQEVK